MRTVLNHVAVSLPRAELDSSVEEIMGFYGEVFGWSGFRLPEDEGEPLVLMINDEPQFVFVYGDSERSATRPMDHFGVDVDDEVTLDEILEKAMRLAAEDPRVRVVPKAVRPAGDVEVVNAYVGFVLPLLVELLDFRRPSV